jgi:hypothetical protein
MPITVPALTQELSMQPRVVPEVVTTGFGERRPTWPARGAAHQPSVEGVTPRFRHVVSVSGDVLTFVGIVFCFPLVILAIGIPIALVLQLLLWIGRLLL